MICLSTVFQSTDTLWSVSVLYSSLQIRYDLSQYCIPVYRYAMICLSTKVCLSPLTAVAAPNTNRNRTDVFLLAYIPRKYYIRCLFFFCMWLYTVSGPTCHLKTWRVCHVVTNIDHRKLKTMAFECPPVAFGRQVSSFESWNLGHREQEYRISLRLWRSAFVCLLRSVGSFVTDVSG
jgi:hypothetical protein